MSKPVDFIVDFETLGNLPDGALIDCAVVPFVNDPENVPSFQELIAKGKKVKFLLSEQKGLRPFDPSVMKWWKEQEDAAKINLKPSSDDVTLAEGLKQIHEHLREAGVKQTSSQGWARGSAFDFSMYVTWIRNVTNQRDTFNDEVIRFWGQRDIRTAIEENLGVRWMTETPLPMGALNGFVAHDSIHDCAKDILMYLYAKRYAFGLEDAPSQEEADPRSLKKKR
ncbi:exonuclease [Citrobacter phage Ci1]|nr:exonuclease [Citrobacter phage Ci1]